MKLITQLLPFDITDESDSDQLSCFHIGEREIEQWKAEPLHCTLPMFQIATFDPDLSSTRAVIDHDAYIDLIDGVCNSMVNPRGRSIKRLMDDNYPVFEHCKNNRLYGDPLDPATCLCGLCYKF